MKFISNDDNLFIFKFVLLLIYSHQYYLADYKGKGNSKSNM